MITVTMPISEYEQMKEDIERLKKESIYNHVKREYKDINRNEYEITLDARAIAREIIEKENKHVKITTI